MNASAKLYPLAIIAITAIAFSLRLLYAAQSHPFIDEFTTVFAAQMILQRGLPILPSGLFYEHGLLFSYLATPFVALAGMPPTFLVARLSSIMLSTALVPLIYQVGRRWFSPGVGLIAALLFVLSPEGIVWGGRVRMYALAQLLVLLWVYFAYEGIEARRLRWVSLLLLLAILLTQLGGLLFVPTLLIGLIVVRGVTAERPRRLTSLSPFSMGEWLAFAGVIALGLFIKRLGQPLGTAALGSAEAGHAFQALWYTVSYQMGVVLDYEATIKFLARQFGVPHHVWLTTAAGVGLLALSFNWLRGKAAKNSTHLPLLFLWLVFGLVVVEMVTVLQPFRRNPRYLVMGLPLFYLLVAGGLKQIQQLFQQKLLGLSEDETYRHNAVPPPPWPSPSRGRELSPSPLRERGWGEGGTSSQLTARFRSHHKRSVSQFIFPLLCLILAILHGQALWTDLRVAYLTPEPAYEEAFAYVAAHQQSGDVVLTMNPTPAALYLNQLDYFAMQTDADQFLLNRETVPVDRWLGRPWVGSAAAFNQIINDHPQAWFVVDTIRLPVYYRGDWQAILASQMDLVWARDEALVYRTKLHREPLPSEPDALFDVTFADKIILQGTSQALLPPTTNREGQYQLTLFWQVQQPLDVDYTVFIHIRDQAGQIVAQQDAQPLNGLYPSSQWQPLEMIIDRHTIPLSPDLPAGAYEIWIGLYHLETLTRLPLSGSDPGQDALFLDTFFIP